jgi:hypothetical protein
VRDGVSSLLSVGTRCHRSSDDRAPYNGIPTLIFKNTRWADLGDSKGDAIESPDGKHTSSFLRSEKVCFLRDVTPRCSIEITCRADRIVDCEAQCAAPYCRFGMVGLRGNSSFPHACSGVQLSARSLESLIWRIPRQLYARVRQVLSR